MGNKAGQITNQLGLIGITNNPRGFLVDHILAAGERHILYLNNIGFQTIKLFDNASPLSGSYLGGHGSLAHFISNL